MLRIIKESKPAWVIGENVTGIINMELDTVLSDLEGEGFEAIPFVIPACGINAWHRRNRVWILGFNQRNWDVAHGRGEKSDRVSCISREESKKAGNITARGFTADTTSGEHGQHPSEQKGRSKVDGYNTTSSRKQNTLTDTTGKRGGRIRDKGKAQGASRGDELSGELRGIHGTGKEHIITDSISMAAGAKRGGVSGTGGKTEGEAQKRDWWQVEPGVDRAFHGLSCKLDENITENERKRSNQILRILWEIVEAQDLQWKVRGLNSLQKEEILQSYLWELQEGTDTSYYLSFKSKEAFEGFLRSLWFIEKAGSPSYRPESEEQYTEQYTDALQIMSRLLAYISEKRGTDDSWKDAFTGTDVWGTEGKWEWGVPRVVESEKGRVDRLKGLGNAIVPEIAYIFFMMIRQIETEMQKAEVKRQK